MEAEKTPIEVIAEKSKEILEIVSGFASSGEKGQAIARFQEGLMWAQFASNVEKKDN